MTPGPTFAALCTNTLISTDSLSALSHLAFVFLLLSDRQLRGDCPSQSERFYYKKPLLERRPLPQIKHTCTHVSVQSDTQTILTQAHGCTFRRPTQRSTRTHTHTHALSRLYLSSVNQISARVGRLAQSRGRSVLGAHCREPCCQPTAPTLMTLLLCTIHPSGTGPAVTDSAIDVKYVT